MCVIGNPPYAVSSSNKSEWIERLTADYKKDMVERNIQPLSDDYIKFIRFGQHFIDKNGSGVLAFISNNSFIDGIIHRQMRKHLLESFDKIYILDLHGNAKRKEICPDGSPDQNVFDIMQGVSINIFIKTGNKKKKDLAKIYNYDLWGTRGFKYDFLNENNLKTLNWKLLKYTSPNYFFVKKNFEGINEYERYFDVSKLFLINSVGVVTSCDDKVLDENKDDLKIKIKKYFAEEEFNNDKILNYLYRPFENKKIYFEPKYLGRSREKIMQHYKKKNVGLIISKQFGGHKQFILFITNSINDKSSQPFAPYYNHPLYLYPETKGQQTIDQSEERTPNLNTEIVNQIAVKVGLTFTNEKKTTKDTFAPIDLLDYIYGVLHSQTYREKYKEFLKIDFPRVPYPKNKDTFWKLVKLGGEIRQIHLLESPVVEKYISKYPHTGTNIVGKPKYENGKVIINDTQYFEDVPEVAWNFYIGGYQPAQKWLKDRKDRELQVDDIRHYMKIIVALTETDRLMKEIDKIEIE
jgi:predicted helicase